MLAFKRRTLPGLFALASVALLGQEPTTPAAQNPQDGTTTPAIQPGQPAPPPDKRVFGVLPNYRTANASEIYSPITAKQKMTIAAKDSFDYPLVILAAALAGAGQLTNQNPSFGQGMSGYGLRVGTAYGDQAIGNLMTEGFFPIMLHEDPRYFRRGTGSTWSRFGYALSRVLVTRTDSGGTRFNFSEVLGNATGVAISNSYYPDNRKAGDNIAKLGEQISTDAISQVLKEFWPDIKRKWFHRGGEK